MTNNGNINRAVGELDICALCDSSPHVVGCPHHPDYDDDRVQYAFASDPEDAGLARYWVSDTFGQAARDAGVLHEDDALREGLAEFRAALDRGELRRVR